MALIAPALIEWWFKPHDDCIAMSLEKRVNDEFPRLAALLVAGNCFVTVEWVIPKSF